MFKIISSRHFGFHNIPKVTLHKEGDLTLHYSVCVNIIRELIDSGQNLGELKTRTMCLLFHHKEGVLKKTYVSFSGGSKTRDKSLRAVNTLNDLISKKSNLSYNIECISFQDRQRIHVDSPQKVFINYDKVSMFMLKARYINRVLQGQFDACLKSIELPKKVWEAFKKHNILDIYLTEFNRYHFRNSHFRNSKEPFDYMAYMALFSHSSWPNFATYFYDTQKSISNLNFLFPSLEHGLDTGNISYESCGQEILFFHLIYSDNTDWQNLLKKFLLFIGYPSIEIDNIQKKLREFLESYLEKVDKYTLRQFADSLSECAEDSMIEFINNRRLFQTSNSDTFNMLCVKGLKKHQNDDNENQFSERIIPPCHVCNAKLPSHLKELLDE